MVLLQPKCSMHDGVGRGSKLVIVPMEKWEGGFPLARMFIWLAVVCPYCQLQVVTEVSFNTGHFKRSKCHRLQSNHMPYHVSDVPHVCMLLHLSRPSSACLRLPTNAQLPCLSHLCISQCSCGCIAGLHVDSGCDV